jgi:hypothetical protein
MNYVEEANACWARAELQRELAAIEPTREQWLIEVLRREAAALFANDARPRSIEREDGN